MAFVTLGVVSNVWARLLPDTPLEALCREAAHLGYGHVELRQGSLGAYEEGDTSGPPPPRVDELAQLRERAPGLTYNLAVDCAFLSAAVSPQDTLFQTQILAAQALDTDAPVLRLVDLTPAHACLNEEERAAQAEVVAGLAGAAWEQGVRLVLENSRQPLSVLLDVMARARVQLGDSVPAPQLCWDPANMLNTPLAVEDPHAAAVTLSPDDLYEFHFKQMRAQVLEKTVGDGDLDWTRLLGTLHPAGYRGPALFEIPPGEDIWDRLDESRRYIEGILARL